MEGAGGMWVEAVEGVGERLSKSWEGIGEVGVSIPFEGAGAA